jgi:putative FmdB family regulatory protein
MISLFRGFGLENGISHAIFPAASLKLLIPYGVAAMPTYDYECKACAHKFSTFQSMKDEPLKTCPECKKDKLKRLLGTGAGFIFKGSGFYCTDYRSSTYNSAAKGESSSTEASKPEPKKAESAKEKKKTDAA